MQLFCEKYKVVVEDGEHAVCEHLEEYCKFREACIINFITREKMRPERKDLVKDKQGKGSAENG